MWMSNGVLLVAALLFTGTGGRIEELGTPGVEDGSPGQQMDSYAKLSEHHLPDVEVPLPLDDPDTHQRLKAGGSDLDDTLRKQFPGQFFSQQDIDEINKRNRRKKRQVDRDVCCKTRLWFGQAPVELTDIVNGEKLRVLRGSKLQQAYSRGDCHETNENVSSAFCPPGGRCTQKQRLKMLWVRSSDMAKLRYFLVNSHCAYEQV